MAFADTPIVRIAILLFVALAIAAAWRVMNWWQRKRVEQLGHDALLLPAIIAEQVAGGTAAILSFSTRTCAECRTRQAPALKRLGAAFGPQVRVVSLDAIDYAELAAQLGVLTVPSTVVLDQRQRVRHLNLGYASEQRLEEQLRGL